MTYNIDFLIAAMVILLLVLWYFLGQKRAEDLNNQVFLFFAVIGILDVVAELASNYYISFPNSNCEIAAMLATTIFYLLQALLPFTVMPSRATARTPASPSSASSWATAPAGSCTKTPKMNRFLT